MPADTNPHGDIFGGWLLSQMDLAAANVAARRAAGRIATIAVDAMSFHESVEVGDEISCYATIHRVGRTSVTVEVVTYKRKIYQKERIRVTSGLFTYVKIDANRRPEPLPPAEDELGS